MCTLFAARIRSISRGRPQHPTLWSKGYLVQLANDVTGKDETSLLDQMKAHGIARRKDAYNHHRTQVTW